MEAGAKLKTQSQPRRSSTYWAFPDARTVRNMPSEHNATITSTELPSQTTARFLRKENSLQKNGSAITNERLMEICDVLVPEDTLLDAQLVQRLAYTSLEQVLFFTNQIPL